MQKKGNTDFGIAANLIHDNGYRRLNNEKLGRMGVKLKHNSKGFKGLYYGVNLNAGITNKRDFLLWEDADYGALKQNETTAMELHGSSLALDPFIGLKKNERSLHDLRTRIQLTDNKIPDAPHNNSKAFSFLGEYHFRHNVSEHIAFNLGLSENFSRIHSPFYGDHTGMNIAGFAQFDVKPSERFKLSMLVKNILNIEYMGRPGDIMPQRNFSIRISGNF